MIYFNKAFLAKKYLFQKLFIGDILPKLIGKWYFTTTEAPSKIKENVIEMTTFILAKIIFF